MTVLADAPEASSTIEGPPPGVRSLCDIRVDASAPPIANALLMRWSMPRVERRPASPVRSADSSSVLRSKPRSAPVGSVFNWRRKAASLIARWTNFARASFDMSFLLRFGAAGRLVLSEARIVHRCDASSVKLMTFGYLPYPPLLLKLRQIDRIAARPTDA